MSSKNIKNSTSIYLITLTIWFTIAVLYLFHLPPAMICWDRNAHVEYTRIIAIEHRIPLPYEGLETFHPPLYYFLNSFFFQGSLHEDTTVHILFVAMLSILYGGIALCLIAWLMDHIAKNSTLKLIALSLIATTPQFFFVFSSYSNDSLATLLCMALVVISYKLYIKWSWRLAAVHFFIASAGLYTKYSMIWCILVIVLLCLGNVFSLKLPGKSQIYIALLLLLSFLTFLPWAIFHNYPHSGKYFPFRKANEEIILRKFNYKESIKTLRTILKLPLLNSGESEWSEPWVYPRTDNKATKRYDYFSYAFVSSIIGEQKFDKPNVIFIWIILWIRLLIYILCLKEIFNTNLTKLAGSGILLTHLVHILNLARLKIPFSGFFMSYRFLVWDVVFWALLYLSVLQEKSASGGMLSRIMRSLICLGIFFQLYLLCTVSCNF